MSMLKKELKRLFDEALSLLKYIFEVKRFRFVTVKLEFDGSKRVYWRIW